MLFRTFLCQKKTKKWRGAEGLFVSFPTAAGYEILPGGFLLKNKRKKKKKKAFNFVYSGKEGICR